MSRYRGLAATKKRKMFILYVYTVSQKRAKFAKSVSLKGVDVFNFAESISIHI